MVALLYIFFNKKTLFYLIITGKIAHKLTTHVFIIQMEKNHYDECSRNY